MRKTTTTNDNNDGDGDGEEYMIYIYISGSACYRMLCGDTAHLHKKVLPEVVFGEFHAAIRAPSQPGEESGWCESGSKNPVMWCMHVHVPNQGGMMMGWG
jgi:hypothetical protein